MANDTCKHVRIIGTQAINYTQGYWGKGVLSLLHQMKNA